MNTKFPHLKLLAVSLCFLCACSPKTKDTPKIENPIPAYGIVIHGGAGTIMKKNMTPEKEEAYGQMLDSALSAGYTILENGGNSLDAVQSAIEILENSPLFNAGKGAVFNHEGRHEMDASIMNGKDRNAGAVAGVSTIRNPIQAARLVMEKSEHVMLSGAGAEIFAIAHGIATEDSSYFSTESRRQSLDKALEREKAEGISENRELWIDSKFGTVGACALDKQGNLAAGTSTGGMTNKKYGRIGDSPIIGAGTYAYDSTCAISCTGWGEYYIRSVAAKSVSDRIEYGDIALGDAMELTLYQDIEKLGGDGGIIGIDRYGNVEWIFNTPGMYRASITSTTEKCIHFYEDLVE
jgi:L-asparaginase / beta-aspartyl-peptidase